MPTIHNIGPGDPIKGQVSTTGSVGEENIIRTLKKNGFFYSANKLTFNILQNFIIIADNESYKTGHDVQAFKKSEI